MLRAGSPTRWSYRTRPRYGFTIIAATGLVLTAYAVFPPLAGPPRPASAAAASAHLAVRPNPPPAGQAAPAAGALPTPAGSRRSPQPSAPAKPAAAPARPEPRSPEPGAPAGQAPATPAPTRPAPPGRFVVAGYYPVDWAGDRASYNSVQEHGADLDTAVYFGYTPDWTGRLQHPFAADEARFLALSKQRGIQALVAVHNYAGGSFDRRLAHHLLTDGAARRRAVDDILRLMEKGYAGVNVDLENLPPYDRQSFTAFIGELAARLRPDGRLVTVAVPAKTADAPGHGWSGAYDYAALGGIADAVMVMAYDEHWLGGTPGPVASIGWVDDVARYAATAMPRRKVLLGIAAYGYDWAVDGRGQTVALSAPRSLDRARKLGVPVQWDAGAQVPWYRYLAADGARVVYYENASSMAAKVDLVTRYGLGGIALWRLGHEDATAWRGVVRGKLR